MDVAVVGGSAGGLSTALVLARRGHRVTVLDRDDLTPAPDLETAAAEALRPTAPQIVQPHVLLAGTRVLLEQLLPDVLAALYTAGARVAPLASQMAATLQDRSPRPGDDELRPIMCRRAALDWVLARAAATEPGVGVRPGVTVTGLLADRPDDGPDGAGPPRVRGVRTSAGDVAADLVVDAAGRRSAIDRWLDGIGARRSSVESAACGLAYFGRQYRMREGAPLPGPETARVVMGLDEFTLGIWAGDNRTAQIALAPLAADRRFRAARDPDVFDATLRTVPYYAAWLDVLDPISEVAVMGGLHNTFRRLVVDGRPVALGLFAVGDAVCTTNPTFGRGIGVALRTVADLAEVLAAHPDDPEAAALAMDRAVVEHVRPWFADQAASDAARLAALRHSVLGEQAPDPPPPRADRVSFTELRRASLVDPLAFRAVVRIMGMVGDPGTLYTDPEIVAATRAALDRVATAVPQPTRAELEEALRPTPASSGCAPCAAPARPG
ncbi:FAD-dependent oxidoreductase [Actinomycetospora flava]|uniref:FAD-dependent oxidoreductase n=1 Tax=Actinomycetospora flava TaxID=3129232 RepID=A0ABU8LXI7_9PSEU